MAGREKKKSIPPPIKKPKNQERAKSSNVRPGEFPVLSQYCFTSGGALPSIPTSFSLCFQYTICFQEGVVRF